MDPCWEICPTCLRDRDARHAQGWLIVTSAQARGHRFKLYPGWQGLGSSDRCDIVLPAIGVSMRHCAIICEARAIHLEDLQSAGGTFVNHRRISAVTRLCDRDQLRIGEVVLSLRVV